MRADRHQIGGAFSICCANCGIVIQNDNPRAIYCSEDCRKAAQNGRYYAAHRDHMILRVQRRRNKQRIS